MIQSAQDTPRYHKGSLITSSIQKSCPDRACRFKLSISMHGVILSIFFMKTYDPITFTFLVQVIVKIVSSVALLRSFQLYRISVRQTMVDFYQIISSLLSFYSPPLPLPLAVSPHVSITTRMDTITSCPRANQSVLYIQGTIVLPMPRLSIRNICMNLRKYPGPHAWFRRKSRMSLWTGHTL